MADQPAVVGSGGPPCGPRGITGDPAASAAMAVGEERRQSPHRGTSAGAHLSALNRVQSVGFLMA